MPCINFWLQFGEPFFVFSDFISLKVSDLLGL